MTDGFDIVALPRSRRVIVDTGRAAARRHTVVGLLAFDVTDALERMRAVPDPRPTLTGYLVACIARAAAEHPAVHAVRDLRGRLWIPQRCDVNVSVETRFEGRSFPMNHLLRGAEQRHPADLSAELSRVKNDPGSSPTAALASSAALLLRLPGWIRSRLIGLLFRLPRKQQQLAGTIGVTSVGMFGAGPAHGIALQVHTLDVVVGGLDDQARVVDGAIETRQMLHVTLMIDHDVVDGAPAARFAARLRHIVESADLLDPSSDPSSGSL